MAVNTPKTLRNQIIYSVFVRNYSAEGTFEEVRKDLARIRRLGTDILWLMPIHPIGEKNRKGTLGSPYAIADYRAVNPEYGTEEDLRALVSDAHALGMKVMIDVVYNHTSPDSVLKEEHPEWFFRREDGSFGNKVGDWWDVIDLDYAHEDLWDYQIETLVQWAGIVDGFRCDVATVVPAAFWEKARKAVAEVRPDAVWLAESVETEFIRFLRSRSIPAWSDAELYTAFDLEYEYDIYDEFYGFLKGEKPLAEYCAAVNRQECMYPENYGKARYLENHDRPRIRSIVQDTGILKNWMALQFFHKGTVLLYAGQEAGCTHQPSLFDRDPVDWQAEDGIDLSAYIRRLSEIKHLPVFTDSSYRMTAVSGNIAAAVHTENEWLPDEKEERKGGAAAGFFCLKENEDAAETEACRIDLAGIRTGDGRCLADLFADGTYKDLISGATVAIQDGCLDFHGDPVILLR